MQLALVNNKRTPPSPKLKGKCPVCGQDMIAKCGKYRRFHWAHKSKENCDFWKEHETNWHIDWKNKFPTEWQEIIHTDPVSREKHIADVKTSYGMVLEFQHSHIDSKERESRENFYKNMIWIVDGRRLKTDKTRFEKALSKIQAFPQNKALKTIKDYEKVFPKNWLDSQTFIFMDYGTNNLLCIFPKKYENQLVLAFIEKEKLVEYSKQNSLIKILQRHFQRLYPSPSPVPVLPSARPRNFCPPVDPQFLKLLFGSYAPRNNFRRTSKKSFRKTYKNSKIYKTGRNRPFF